MHLITMILVLGAVILSACNQRTDMGEPPKDLPALSSEQYKKELDDIRKGIRTETKIKLKKDGKGSYSWEIQGKDANEVLKVNDTLRRKLGE
jgi:hypothetical protein